LAKGGEINLDQWDYPKEPILWEFKSEKRGVMKGKQSDRSSSTRQKKERDMALRTGEPEKNRGVGKRRGNL